MTLFNEQQLATLRAAINRIIPPDADYPGAWEAGVGDFIERLLRDDLQHLQPTYHDGLETLDAIAQETHSQDFARLTHTQQDVLLSQVETSTSAAAAFFRLLCEHTIEGYYSDPGNGGNKDQISWKMIGYEVKPWPTTTQS